MIKSTEKSDLREFAHVMKRDWDDRARHDAKWFINTLRFQQTEDEFDRSGQIEVERLVLADLPLLTQRRDPKSLRVLEIGCGVGRMTKYLAEVFGEVLGVDVSGEMIRQAKERLAGIPNAGFLETDGLNFEGLADASFDLILSAYVFQHVPSAGVILSNLSDSWRVLKPGGIVRFQTNSITTLDFEDIEKDTWAGATLSEDEIRRFALENDAQLISIFGAGTQYCWTTLGKRPVNEMASGPTTQPKIECYGLTIDSSIKKIPTSGNAASLTLVISGLNNAKCDCNSVQVEIDGVPVRSRYVGPVGRNFAAAVKERFGDSFDHLMQIEIGVPPVLPAGFRQVAVRSSGEAVTPSIEIEFEDPIPAAPKITSVINTHDGGRDIHARGPKSKIRALVEGLNDAADTGNVRLIVGDHILKPSFIGYLPGKAIYEVDASLPGDIQPGKFVINIVFGNLQSDGEEIEIV